MKLLSWWRRKKRPVAPTRTAPVRFLSYQCAAIHEIGRRENQEDALELVNGSDVSRIRQEGLLALVADGMGGMASGALASETGIRTITRDFQNMDRAQPLEVQLAQSVLNAADAVYGILQGKGGSTVVACILFEEQLYYAGMGDSFLYLLRQGKLIRINREQNMRHQHYLRMIRMGQVDHSGKTHISQPEAVTSFLGIDQPEDVDWLTRSLPLMEYDVLLLCSDGVGGVLTPGEICSCLSIPDANEAAAALRQGVLSKGLPNQDNFTAIVIRCEK